MSSKMYCKNMLSYSAEALALLSKGYYCPNILLCCKFCNRECENPCEGSGCNNFVSLKEAIAIVL